MTDRALSTIVSYVLTLGIVVLLLSTMTGVFAPLVTNQQDAAVRATLEVLGNDIAGDLESADRLAAAAGENGTVELRTRLPDRVGGSPYEIEVDQASDQIVLESPDSETTVRVTVTTETDVEVSGTLDGGTLEISYDTTEEQLVIENV